MVNSHGCCDAVEIQVAFGVGFRPLDALGMVRPEPMQVRALLPGAGQMRSPYAGCSRICSLLAAIGIDRWWRWSPKFAAIVIIPGLLRRPYGFAAARDGYLCGAGTRPRNGSSSLQRPQKQKNRIPTAARSIPMTVRKPDTTPLRRCCRASRSCRRCCDAIPVFRLITLSGRTHVASRCPSEAYCVPGPWMSWMFAN